jgi:lipopolysaccharide assembly protein B
VEWLLLLLPVAAASGWLAGRRSAETANAKGDSQLNSTYFTGLNYLLNEQPDKAIDAFITALEVDSNTVEPYLALGNLFRRRGEVDRAIRIHQDLIERPRLTRSQKDQALVELGLDYMRAGMLDRAESLFLEALKQKDYLGVALRQLLDIYQQEKKWHQAIAVARRLNEELSEATDPMIAHFYCELAKQQFTQQQASEARKFIKQALNSDWRCVRAILLQAHFAMEKHEHRAAIRLLRQVERQDPDYLPEIIRPLAECYQHLGRQDRFFSWLAKALLRYPGCTPLILAMAAHLRQEKGEEATRRFLIAQLRVHPSLESLRQLLALGIPEEASASLESWVLVEKMIEHLLKAKPSYICRYCGFGGKHRYWQCPGCKRWGSVKPITIEIQRVVQ